jgi:DNA modification methylase
MIDKNVLDSVRHIKGFPKGEDEDIISLSNPPYYMACPNPFINDFIKKNGVTYIESTDKYHCEPFTADISEGKNGNIYSAHTYHTKVPYKAIMRYILHYTKPGDIVFDGFSGSGMTGIAAQMCGKPEKDFKNQIEKEMVIEWGARKSILNDLSPSATFISSNYNMPIDAFEFQKEAKLILEKCEKELGWMYETNHVEELNMLKNTKGKIIYTVWSDVLICPSCSNDYVFWDVAVNQDKKSVEKEYSCPHCGRILKKTDCERATDTYYDKNLDKIVTWSKLVPVLINYKFNGKRYEKKPDDNDIEVINKINDISIPYYYPTDNIIDGYNTEQPKRSHGIKYVHQFYTKRNLYALSKIFSLCNTNHLKYWFTACTVMGTKMSRYGKRTGNVSGTLYVPSLIKDMNMFDYFKRKLTGPKGIMKSIKQEGREKGNVIINTASSGDLSNINDNNIDYIFTDPPFGSNLNYSELSFIWESWLKVFTDNKDEAIINKVQKKSLLEYQGIMTDCFKEFYRILKPGRWMTVEFHNSKNSVWNAIQESLQVAGFIIADIRTLDKKQGSFKQVTTSSAVKQDLIISSYKPKEKLTKTFKIETGTSETVWAFVSEQLEHLKVVNLIRNRIEVMAERQAHLLYDRMIAYHIVRGYSIPMDATDFYRGLEERYIERDSMYFLANQVNEYDAARIENELEDIQMELFVSNEKSAIAWLYKVLDNYRMSYQEIQPKYMKELRSVDRYEDIPELSVLLEENFIKDDTGKWYIPDRRKSGDIEKLRIKNLIKEFQGYMESKEKLKAVRTEAIRAGFAKLWEEKKYKLIVDFAERIHESIIQEDEKLLLYYDLSLDRVE